MLTQQQTNPRDGSEYAALLATGEFRTELDRLFPTKGGERSSSEVRFQMLRYHQNRCVFDVNIRTDDGRQSIIAKLFAVDRQDAFDAMQKIHQSGFGQGAPFTVPKPIAYLPSLRILIEEKVEGKQVKSILLEDDKPEQLEAVRRCGAWLARFHDTAPKFGKSVDPRPFLDHVQSWANMVAEFGKPFDYKCKLLMQKLYDMIPAKGGFEYCPGHGSYIPSHVMLNDERTVTIDFDEFELVDPARDLAWFLIALERYELKYGKRHGFYERLSQPFVESYMRMGSQDATRYLPFYKAAEYVHRARHDLYKRNPPVREWAELMLDRAMDGLES